MIEIPALFPIEHYWWFYIGFAVFVLLILLIDLGVFHKEAHEISFKEATAWTSVWISLALAFTGAFYLYCLWKFPLDPRLASIPNLDTAKLASQSALEFLTGYVVEKSLAIDNIFVFVVIFAALGIPAKYQHRILFYGIIGALVFRALFIALGAILMSYQAVVIVFGVFLVFTGIKVIFSSKSIESPENSKLLSLLRRYLPVTSGLHGDKFKVKENGGYKATPLLMALILVEISDIIFAVDSVPAIFAITKEPLIVFTSNVFAILGLRSMYFLLAGIVDKFHMLKFGLGLVLIFVGIKMVWLNELYDGKFPISWSLGVIVVLIGGSILLSFLFPQRAAKS